MGSDLFLHVSLTLSFHTEMIFFLSQLKGKVVRSYVFIAEVVGKEI